MTTGFRGGLDAMAATSLAGERVSAEAKDIELGAGRWGRRATPIATRWSPGPSSSTMPGPSNASTGRFRGNAGFVRSKQGTRAATILARILPHRSVIRSELVTTRQLP